MSVDLRHFGVVVALLGALAVCACADPIEERADWFMGRESAVEPVAVVNGEKIPPNLVYKHASQTHEAIPEALDDLIVGVALYEEAVNAGYAEDQELAVLRKQLMVQRYLEDTIEKPHGPESVPSADVKAYYDEHYYFFRVPEQRIVVHLLAMPDPEKWDPRRGQSVPAEILESCRRVAEDLRREIDRRGWTTADGTRLGELAAQWKPKLPEGVVLHIDDNMPTVRAEFGVPGQVNYFPAMVDEFVAAAFSAPIGEISQPVKTVFGYHILVVLASVPETIVPLAEADPGIRDHLARERRKAALAALVPTMVRAASPKVDLSVVDKLDDQ